jgi:hypothetical protein
MIDIIKKNVKNNSVLLFRKLEGSNNSIIFDYKGFWLSNEAQQFYNQHKNNPHLYIVSTDTNNGYYIGKSFQKGGRWKRSNAYHLRDLTCNILDINPNRDNHNHLHWIENWFDINSLEQIENDCFTLGLLKEIKICFIPFNSYSNLPLLGLDKQEIRRINSNIEIEVIRSYLEDGFGLLNIHHNN